MFFCKIKLLLLRTNYYSEHPSSARAHILRCYYCCCCSVNVAAAVAAAATVALAVANATVAVSASGDPFPLIQSVELEQYL